MSNDDDYKARIKAATEKFLVKNDPNRVHRKNNDPERKLQKEVINWLESLGFSVDNVDSKAQYSADQGRYISQNAKPGISDIIGNDPNGHAVYIELKAPGKRGTLRENQRDFLLRKINSNAFAIVADSKEFIWEAYSNWQNGPLLGAKGYLIALLPPEKLDKDARLPLFTE